MNISTGSTSLIHKLRLLLPSALMKYSCMHATCVFLSCTRLHTIVAAGSHTVLVRHDSVLSRTHWNWNAHTQFWQYNEPTSTVKVITFILLLWPVHGPSQLHTQLAWFCRQRSKSSSVKLGILFSLLFSVFPPFSLHSRQLLSRRASHFSQILFSPFLLAVSVVFVSLSHIVVKQVPLWSRTPPQAEFIGLSSVRACLCECCVKQCCERNVCCENGKARGEWEEICVCDLLSWLPDRVGRVLGPGWSLQSTQPSIDRQPLICKIQWLTGFSVCSPHTYTCERDRCCV